MSVRILSANSPAWAKSLPLFRDPDPGESLAGYVLALDALNGFDAGQTFRMIRRHGVGPSNMTPGNYLTGVCFNLQTLADLAGGLGLMEAVALTVQPLGAWLFADRPRALNAIAHPQFRICPDCFREGLLPMSFLFADVIGCARHGRVLALECSCTTPIMPFMGQTPGACHGIGCSVEYRQLESAPMSATQQEAVGALTRSYEDLVAFARTEPEPLSFRQLRAGLQAVIVARGRMTSLFASIQSTAPLRGIAQVLARTGATPAELQRACLESHAALRSRTRGVLRPEGLCPNPTCAGASEVVRDGHLASSSEAQHACMRCGTRFTRSRVLFAFDALPTYASWRALENRQKLAAHRARVAEVVATEQRPSVYLGVERVFALAGVPTSAPYRSERAGLVHLVDASNARASVKRRRPARQIKLALAP
jgi:hypothetical protein